MDLRRLMPMKRSCAGLGRRTRTRVAIVGSGVTGTLLALLLERAGIDCVVIRTSTNVNAPTPVACDLLEHATVDLLRSAGIGPRLDREGIVADGFVLKWRGARMRVDLRELTGGKTVTFYPHRHLIADLEDALDASSVAVADACGPVALHDIETEAPFLIFSTANGQHRLDCDYLAGCDDNEEFWRHAVPEAFGRTEEYRYPFAHVRCLASSPNTESEPVYAAHERGFASLTMIAPGFALHTLQCEVSELAADWTAARLADELATRLHPNGGYIDSASIREIAVAPLKSWAATSMRIGRLFLAGTAAHALPAIDGRCTNLAAADAFYLARALSAAIEDKDPGLLEAYERTALANWRRAQAFAERFIGLTHRLPDDEGADKNRRRRALLNELQRSTTAAALLADAFVGATW